MQTKMIILLTWSLLLSASSWKAPEPAPEELIYQMFEHTDRIETLSYTMHKYERIDGKMVEQLAEIKFKSSPFQVYARQRFPNDGLEILYREGQNRGRALVNPNGFPWVNINLDPLSYQMRKGQHHTILDTGYDMVMDVLEHLVAKYRSQTGDILKLLDITEIDGRTCYVLELNNPAFHYYKYTVREGETLTSIADRNKLSEHMILEKNEGLDSYTDVQAGQIIEIPNDYCPRMVLTMEKERMIPRVMKIYDEQGLYELYQFDEVRINPRFEPAEFTRDYPGYGF